jgi:hypothetical protein
MPASVAEERELKALTGGVDYPRLDMPYIEKEVKLALRIAA